MEEKRDGKRGRREGMEVKWEGEKCREKRKERQEFDTISNYDRAHHSKYSRILYRLLNWGYILYCTVYECTVLIGT